MIRQTEMLEKVVEDRAFEQKPIAVSRRCGVAEPADVARAVALLAPADSDYIPDLLLAVHGGYLA